MKNKCFLLIAFSFSCCAISFSQPLEEQLKKSFTAFDTARTYPQKVAASDQLKSIADNNGSNWLANYYASLCLAVLSFDEADTKKKDPLLDIAESYFKKIQAKQSTNDEVNVLGALIAEARLTVNPISRYKKYGEIEQQFLDKAKSINADNPRIYYLEGKSIYHTPKGLGGGAAKALPLFKKAEILFAKENKQNITKPYWGKTINQQMINKCNSEIKK